MRQIIFDGEILVTTYDDEGGLFEKSIGLYLTQDQRLVVNFSGPMEYYFADLVKHCPYDRPFTIDMAGRLHKGSPVHVSSEEMNKLIEKVREVYGNG